MCLPAQLAWQLKYATLVSAANDADQSGEKEQPVWLIQARRASAFALRNIMEYAQRSVWVVSELYPVSVFASLNGELYRAPFEQHFCESDCRE